jgi:hypothetical protein
MNVEIRTKAAQFPEKEYMNWIFFAVHIKIFTTDIVKMSNS